MTGPTSTAGPLVRKEPYRNCNIAVRSSSFFCVGVWEVKINHISPTKGQNPEISEASSMISPFPYRSFKKNLVGASATSLPNGQTKILLLRIVASSLEKATAVFGLFRGVFRRVVLRSLTPTKELGWPTTKGKWCRWGKLFRVAPLIHARWETRCFRKKRMNRFTPQGFFPFQTLWRE